MTTPKESQQAQKPITDLEMQRNKEVLTTPKEEESRFQMSVGDTTEVHNKLFPKEEEILRAEIIKKLEPLLYESGSGITPADLAHKNLGGRIIDTILNIRREAIAEEREKNKVTEDTSDGYHTFKELYEFRKIYNAVLFNEWAKQGKYNVHKSKKHSDGQECFGGGWFIVVATLPTGDISNHYELKDWDLFNCEERETAKEWDGHTAKDVVNRLFHLTQE